VLLLALPSGIAVGPKATSSDSFGLISNVLIDNNMLQAYRLVEAIVITGKALIKGIECQICLDPPEEDGEEGGGRGYRTALSVKEDGSLALQGLWCPLRDLSFQGKLKRREIDYRSNLPMDVWRNTKSWVGLGNGLSDFLEFAQAVTFLLPGSVGGGEAVFQMSSDLYRQMYEDAKNTCEDDDEAEITMMEYVDCLAQDTKPIQLSGRHDESFLDSFISNAVQDKKISRKSASIAKSCIARSAYVYRNAFDLNSMVHDEADFRRLAKLFLKDRRRLSVRFIGVPESDSESDTEAALVEAAEAIEAAAAATREADAEAEAEAAEKDRTDADESRYCLDTDGNRVKIQTQPMPDNFMEGDEVERDRAETTTPATVSTDDGEIVIVIDANKTDGSNNKKAGTVQQSPLKRGASGGVSLLKRGKK
jgi:hypothetical protein